MPSLKTIVQKGDGKAGSNQSWRSFVTINDQGVYVCELWHYNTRMLVWDEVDPTDERVLDFDVGHGSVSDQNGMNIAFRTLGLPYRYDRDIKGGGARITELGRTI